MLMRRLKVFLLSASLVSGLSVSSWITPTTIHAADDHPKIENIIDKQTFLLDDGSIWSLIDGERQIHTPGNVTSISEYSLYNGYGVTGDGKLVEWSVGMPPHIVEGESGVQQTEGGYWLKSDGTVWSGGGKVKSLSGIRLIGHGGKRLAALSATGDVLLQDRNKMDLFKNMGTVADANSVTALAVNDGQVAVLFESGKVVMFNTFDFDDNGNITPFTITQDAVHIAFGKGTGSHPTDALLVTRKDGTVWNTGNYSDRSKLTNQVSGLSQIVKTSVLKDFEHFYAMRNDGSWLLYDEGEITEFDVPRVNQLNVSVSDLNPFVGDVLSVDVQENYTNGAEIKVQPGKAVVTVQNPHLLSVQPDGTFKVLGVGQTDVTVSSGGVSETVNISASLRSNLKYAKLVNGVVYIPVKPVFQALGGTVVPAGGGVEATLGNISLSLKTNQKNAQLNGETVPLKAAPITDKHLGMLIPASLLTDAVGATVNWSSQWKQVEIFIGKAKMTVVSADTAGLVKKAAQGNLAKYIGKTYWVNYFQGWERFSKVTVTDIEPVDSGEFVIVFKTASGKQLKSYPMGSSYVTDLFANKSNFFNFDPYKKYKWSTSVWNQIKAGHISRGMTKEQVIMSWGEPVSKDVRGVEGKTLETWVYANFDIVSFIDGKLAVIVT